jgi:ankyrin repeat protein
MIELLMAEGADITKVMSGETALHRAMRANLPDMVRYSLDKGCETSSINLAAYFGELDRVKELLAEQSDVDVKDHCGYIPLHCAICGNHTNVVKLLIDRGSDSNAKIPYSVDWTPLMLAVGTGSPDMVRLLITGGADVNLSATNGNTCLHIAVNRHNLDLVKLLLDHGVNINAQAGPTCKAWEGWTAFHVACRNGKLPIVETLVRHGADLNIKTAKGDTPVSLAQKNNHAEVVEFLQTQRAKK